LSGEKKTSLFEQFSPVTREQWEKQAVKDLKGSDYSKLIWKPYEGFEVKPFYLREDLNSLDCIMKSLPGEFPFTRGKKRNDNNWEVCERITDADIKEANKNALKALEKGSDAICFLCEMNDENIIGVPVQNVEDMSELIRDIPLDKVPISFEPGIAGPEIISTFIAAAENTGYSRKDLRGKLFYDPVSNLALTGRSPFTVKDLLESVSTLIKFSDAEITGYFPLCVTSNEFHESGASHVQELAFAIAKGADYIVHLIEMGLDVDSIARNMFFSFSVGSDYFMEIAKLRAARTMWSSIIKEFVPLEKESCGMNIHINTELWNKTIYDPYVNMIRGTVESMAAAIGGCDSICVTPMNVTYEHSGEFSRRMARNTQLIIKEESYLNRVIDPAAGSYYIENLTQLLLERSFDLFLKIEDKGGYLESLTTGAVQNYISGISERKIEDLKNRKMILVGTNQYPDGNEKMLKYFQHDHREQHLKYSGVSIEAGKKLKLDNLISEFNEMNLTTGDIVRNRKTDEPVEVQSIETYRGGEIFEEIRFDTEKFMGNDETKRPKVFLFKCGNLGMRNARASFSRNFFGCAGFGITEDTGYDNPEEGITPAEKSKADIIVLCSSDNEYEKIASVVCAGIKDKTPEVQIVIAGNPGDKTELLKSKGVDEFIHRGSNAYEKLKKFQKILGIIPQ